MSIHDDYNQYLLSENIALPTDAIQSKYGAMNRKPVAPKTNNPLPLIPTKGAGDFNKDRVELTNSCNTARTKNKAFDGVSFDNDPEIKSYQNSYNEQQKIINSAMARRQAIINHTDPEIKSLYDEVQNNQKAYYEAVQKDSKASCYSVELEKTNNELVKAEEERDKYFLELNTLTQKNQELDNDISALNIEISGYTDKINPISTRISTLTAQKDSIEANETEKEGMSDEEKAQVKSRNAEKEAKRKKFQEEIDSLTKQKKELETKKDAAEKKVAALKEEIAKIKKKSEEIKGEMKKEDQNIARLKKEKNDIETKIKQNCEKETKEAMDKYNSSKANYQKKCDEIDTKLNNEINAAYKKSRELTESIAKRTQFLIEEKKRKEAEEKAKAEQEAAAQAAAANSAGGASGAGGTGGADGTGGASGTSGADGASGSGSTDGAGETNKISEAEMQRITATMNESKQAMDNARNDVISAFDGTSSSLKPIVEKRNIAWDGFIKALENKDPKLAKSINNIKKKYDNAGKELAQAEKDLFEAQSCLPEAQMKLSKSSIELTELESAQTKLNGVGETNLSAEKKTELKNLKTKLEKAIKTKKAEIKKLQEEVSEAQNTSKLETKRDKLKEEYKTLEKELTDKMNEAAEKYKDDVSIESYRKAFSDANEEFNSTQEKEITAKKEAYTKASDKYKTDSEAVYKAQATNSASEYNFTVPSANTLGESVPSSGKIKPGVLKGKLAGKEGVIEQLCAKYGIKDVNFVVAVLGVEHGFGSAKKGIGIKYNNYLSYRAAGDMGKNGNGFGIFSTVEAGLEAGIRNLARYVQRYNDVGEISMKYVDQIARRYCNAHWASSMRTMYKNLT